MESVTVCNFGGPTRKTLAGKEYLVAPLTMLVPGVHVGSRGPILYPVEEIRNSAESWNHMPIVLEHPKDEQDNFVSARQPDVLDSVSLGVVMGAHVDEKGKLKAEGWFEIDRLREVAPEVLSALERGQPIELSTGLFLDAHNISGDWNGESYEAIATNFRPDHLAILPSTKGACSLEDGCGVLVNEEEKTTLKRLFNLLFSRKKIWDREGLTELQRLIEEAARSRFGKESWVQEVFTNRVIVETPNGLVSVSWSRDKEGMVVLGSDETPVKRQVKYVPIGNEGKAMAKKEELVAQLIANCDCWTEEDREVLNSLPEEKLQALLKCGEAPEPVQNQQAEPEQEPEPAANEKSKTLEEWLQEAPVEVQRAVRNAMDAERRERESLVEKLVANAEESQRDALRQTLLSKSLDDLRLMESLIPPKPEPVANRISYVAPPAGPPQKDGTVEVLELPVMNYDKN